MVLDEIETVNGLYGIEAKTYDGKPLPEKLSQCFITTFDSGVSLAGRAAELVHEKQIEQIERLLAAGSPHVCHIKSAYKSGNFTFDIHSFAGSMLNFEKIVLLTKKNEREKYEDAMRTAEFKIDGKTYTYLVIHSSYGKNKKNNKSEDTETNSEDSESKENTDETKDKTEVDWAFSIVAEESLIDVERLKTEEGAYFQVSKIRRRRSNVAQANYFLVQTSEDVTFADKRMFLSEHEKKQLEKIMQNPGSYLKSWENYAQERGEVVLKNARKWGKVRFEKREDIQKTGVVTLNLSESTGSNLQSTQESISALLEIDVSIYDFESPEPIFIQDDKCSWSDYLIKKKEQKQAERKAKRENQEGGESVSSEKKFPIEATVTDVGEKSVSVECKSDGDEKLIPQKGYFVLSIAGEEIQIERQNKAREKIASGNCPIPHLGSLLESQAQILQTQHPAKFKGLQDFVRKKIFSFASPTENQLEAIKTALTTPDIALIQGPPGTGKTTVINAIIEELNILHDKNKSSAGQILVTSFQHDAVVNIVERLRVNSLPTYKFGAKKGESAYSEHIEQWTKDVAKRVRDKNPDLQEDKDTAAITSSLLDYKLFPTRQNAENLLRVISNCALAASDIQQKAQKQLIELRNGNVDSDLDDNYREKLLCTVKALRTSEASFDDDGNARAVDLFLLFDEMKKKGIFDYLSANQMTANLLEKAARAKLSEMENKAEFLNGIKRLKITLLDDFAFKPPYAENQIDENIVSLAEDALNSIQESYLSKTDAKNRIISEWVSLLENNPFSLVPSIKECDYVFASSIQQSVGKEILSQKDDLATYDTVIVDEAARAAPPDLLIPMCSGRRIILVGDHRQLPQLLDDEVCKALEQKEDSDETSKTAQGIAQTGKIGDALKLSLFEVLFGRLKELEKSDGIKRTVTLNAQYRSHPVLGNFVSDEFYRQHGEQFYSPRSAEDFSHSLLGIENKAAVWIDVPSSKHESFEGGGSLSRKLEAEIIAEKLKSWAESENGKKLSYGVITFYRKQVEVLENEIGKTKLPKDVKLKIGTVDSFQGMEFDVVFLSVVRNKSNAKGKHPFGFLCSKNRLCVAMSREKKVLICVGDKDFCTSEDARKEENIPALARFYDLCSTSEWGKVL